MPNDTIEVFISYSKQDKELRDGLLSHLRPLEKQGIITWHDRQITPGTNWDDEIKARLNAADIILLLVSADFLATDYCTQVEIPEALRRHDAGDAIVMPVILRSCAWKYTPLAAIQAYPEKAKPIKSWSDIDEAYTNVVDAVYVAATEIKNRRQQRQAEQLRQQQEAEAYRRQEQQALERQRELEQQREQERQKQQQQNELASERGVDYRPLRDLLAAGNWQEADQETAKRMCEVMGRQQEGWLRVEDIQAFPCTDLRTIDQLWVKYSQGHFGFSVQKKIWEECGSPMDYGKNWNRFCEKIGWKKNESYVNYRDLKFNLRYSLQRELPMVGGFVGNDDLGTGFFGVWGWVGFLFSRAETCRL